MPLCLLGAMAPRCHGTLVPRCHGATVPWYHGSLVPWCHGAMVPRCLAATVRWCHGATVSCCLGPTVPCCLGALVPWFHGALVPWCHGAMAPRCQAVLAPWCHGATMPVCHSAMAPRRLGAMARWCFGALVQWRHGDMVPRCTDIQLDKDTTMEGHYTSVGVRHWRRLQHYTRRSQKPLIAARLHAPTLFSVLHRALMPHSESRKTSSCDAIVFCERPLDIVSLTVWNGKHATLEKQEANSDEGKTNLSHDGLNPAHVPYWWVNNPTLGEFCFTMIGRADIEGSKWNVSMNAWLPQASYPYGNFSDTSSFEYRRSKGSLGHAFTMCRPSQTPHLTMSYGRIGPQSEPWVQKRGQYPASDSRNNRIPLVRTSSEWVVRRAGKAPEGTVPSLSPGRHAATRSRRGSSSSSPPTADGFGTGTPVPSPQSQSFSRSYGSILPTSLAYIVPSTRGCSPWRPDAVMSTTGRGRHSVLRIFKGRRERTGHHTTCGALPAAGLYLRLSQFQGGQDVKQKR
ncbi:hypothetical protein CQW23_34922 [Capsicum baccatum]|uniref:Protein TAR1 n=1 Tax=Capsicum baccatum TaxID=33114 RepID=A0A2G2UXG6_CAPBA|nr:hypothetical protein CQW23_34922 [Capsicum baccatum]